MFRKDTPADGDNVETVIGPSVKVEGDFVSQGNIVVDGAVTGSICTSKNLRVGQGAYIQANIEAANAIVAGKIVGHLKIQNRLEILATAVIIGDITMAQLSLEAGAHFTGQCTMTAPVAQEEKTKRQPSTVATEKPSTARLNA